MSTPPTNPFQALGKAFFEAAAAFNEVPIAADLRKASAKFVGFVLDDQVLPRFRSQLNTVIAQQLRQHPDFPLTEVVVNLLDHQNVVVQGVYTHWLGLGTGRCDFDVRMALLVTVADNLELHLTIGEVTARPTGLIGLFVPPISEDEVRTRLKDKLRKLPADHRLRMQGDVIVINAWRELSALMDRRST